MSRTTEPVQYHMLGYDSLFVCGRVFGQFLLD